MSHTADMNDGFVLLAATEVVGTSKRKVAAMGHKLAYSVGAMLLACVASELRAWRAIELAISLPSLLFLSYKW